MEYDEGKGPAISRVTRRRLRQKKYPSLPAERSGLAAIAAAALVLALAAFFSGVWIGRAMSDLENSGAAGMRAGREANVLSADAGISAGQSAEEPGGKSAAPESRKPKGELLQGKAGDGEFSNAKPAAAIAKGKTDETNAKPAEARPASPPKPRFTLQVAALHNPEEARDLVAKLRGKGYPAYQITGTAAAKGTLYRVRFGQFQSLQEARQSALEFEKKEKTKTIITALQ